MAIKEIEYKNNLFEISYNIINPNQKNSILFLHGWGSNKEIMQQAFVKELKNFTHIYVDMPGFGKSENEKLILNTKDYVNIIEIFLKKIKQNPSIVVGHSFGGKVATLLNPKCLILLSSAGILVPKTFKVKLKIAIFKVLKPFGIVKFKNFFVSNDAKEMNQIMYETFKNVVNEDFENNFKSFKNKVLLFWGKDDSATPLWTGEKIHSLIPSSKLYPLDGDHYFFLKNSNFISKKIKSECL